MIVSALVVVVLPAATARANEGGAGTSDAAKMAKKLQDPLAEIAAISVEFTLLAKTGEDDTSYSFQIQPIKSFPIEALRINLVLRAVVPFLGLAPEAQRPILQEPLPAGDGISWGLSDSIVQTFISPRTDSPWKWGVGPMFSLRTHSKDEFAGPSWGAGPVGVGVGSIGNLSVAGIAGHLWNYDNDYSTTILRPILLYSIAAVPGLVVGYNMNSSYNWKAESSSDAWTIPLGATVGKLFKLGNYGLDLSGGAYWNAVRPEGAATWMFRTNVTLLLP